MTQRQIAIRIGLDGKADFQRDISDIGATGDATFAQLGKALDQATGAIQRQKDNFDKLAEAQANVEKQRSNQTAFNQVLGVNPQSGAGSAQASAAAFQSAYSGMEARAAALRAQIDPLGAAQSKMNTAIADANALLATGTINEAEHAAAVMLAQRAYKDAESALKSFGAMEGLGSTQAMALTAAVRHMIDATVAGRPPLQSLAMEAGNLSYGLSGSGGVLTAVKALGGGILSFLVSPLGLAGIALVALGGSALIGFSRAQEAEKQFADATQFAGRASGLTRDSFEATAASAAKSGAITISSARDIESAFAKSGAVGQQSLLGLIAVTQQYARATGQSMDAARDTLVKAFSDPVKSGEQLLASLGALDDKTKQNIETFEASGHTMDAQKVVLDALKKAIKEAEDQTGVWAGIWNTVKGAANGAIEAMSKPFQTPSLAAERAALQNELSLAQHGIGLPHYDPESHSTRTTSEPRAVSDILSDLARVNAAIAQTARNAKDAAADATATTLSNAAGPLVRSAIPGLTDLKNLQAGKSVMDQLAGNQAAISKLGATTADAAQAQDAYNRAIQTYIDPATKAAKLNQLDIDALNAKTPAQKAAIAQQRTALELAGQVVSTATANAKIQQAGALAYAQAKNALDKHTSSLHANLTAQLAVADAYLKGSAAGVVAEEGVKKLDEQVGKAAISGAKQVAQLRDETAARKSLNDQVAAGTLSAQDASQQMQIANALAPLRIAYDLAEGNAKAELKKIIDALTAARKSDNAEQLRTKALDEVDSSNRNLALLRQELAVANDNDAQRQVEIAVLQEKSKLLGEHISLESAEGKQLIANAAAAAAINEQLDLARASRGELEGLFDSLGSQFSSFITQAKFDWADFAKAALSAIQDIESEFIKLAVLNPLKNLLFGTNLPDLNSVGGVLGSLLGGGTSQASEMATWGGVFHGGGMAEAANTNVRLPANVFRFAPRLHGGAFLGPDEVPAVLQTGEQVLNRQETRAYRNRNNGGVTLMPGAVVIQTPSPAAFQASAGQISAKIARAVQSGMRNL